MKLCIFGAGAVGGHIAAKLAAGGHEVSVVARGEHLEAMRRDGIRLLHGERTTVGRVRAVASARELRDALSAADMASPPVEDIRQSIWAKLTQNLWTSTLCTLTELTVREVQDDAELAPIAERAREEAGAIARALGVAIERAPRRP